LRDFLRLRRMFCITEDAMARYEVTDEQWELLKGLFPRQSRGGRWLDHRTMLNGMLWILRSGASWRDLPERYGKWQSVNHRFNRWRRDGTFDRVLKALQIRLDKQGKIDWDLWLVDGTSIRASRAAAGARKKTAPPTASSRSTTHWAAAAADGDQSSTWSLTARALSSGPRSRPARATNRRSSTT
jgi:transposase